MMTRPRDQVSAKERMVYIEEHISEPHPSMKKLQELTKTHESGDMLSFYDGTVLLSNMIKFAGAKKCIDVGVFTGYSSLAWALSVPEDGKVVACDTSTEFTDIGKPFWKEAGVEHKIDLRIAPAAETLQAMIDGGESGTYDFMFIDADKESYDTYYEQGLQLLRQGGIIAIDNCFRMGRCMIESDTSPGVQTMRQLNAKIKKDPRVTAVMVNVADGTFVCLKN
ncbi:COMTD1 [Bugula neritina]|uniref:COMTD1 n=1 Tax=Bugula neritina TaxID=10212 RepID=A0A7J7KCL3_BUGNE|nr:COMTD1 [Bugula neritina]